MSFHRGFCMVLSIVCATSAADARAQGASDSRDAPVVMAGYVINAPHQLLGVGAAFLPRGLGGWGLYANARTGTNSPTDDQWYRGDLSRQQAVGFGDLETDDRTMWTSYNAAVVRALRGDLLIYLGGGVSREDVYYEFFDSTRERAEFGYYWLEDQEASGWRTNLMGGMFLRIGGHVMVQIGADSRPRGFSVGLLGAF